MKSFFILVWIMFSCTNAPIHNQVIRHGVIDYYELIEPLGIKHLYREKPVSFNYQRICSIWGIHQ